MRDWDIEMLYHFISRPGMYTGETEERGYKGIDKFLMAYELGSKGECNFRNEVSNLILTKYNIPMPSSGLIEQLKIAADSENIDWIELFKELGEKIIVQHSDKSKEFKYRRLLRNKILKLINKQNIEEVLINFHQFERQTTECKGVNLDEDEINQLKKVMSILKSNPVQFGSKISNRASSEIMRLKEIIETKHDR